MRNTFTRPLAILAVAAMLLNSCSKTAVVNPKPTADDDQQTVTPVHHYGVLPASADQYSTVPLYSPDRFRSIITENSTQALTPGVVTLINPPIRDQGQLGSCTAFCGTEAFEILYYYAHGSFPTTLSPAFLYYCERVKVLGEKITADDGAYMVDIPQVLQTYGLCLETLYPYPASNKSKAYKTAPSSADFSNGLTYRIGQTISSYALINAGDTAAVKNVLRHNIPVMMGLNVYDNSKYQYFEGLSTTSYTYNPLTTSGALAKGVQLLGGHATPIIGYDDTRKAFLVQNSWGTSWGNKGFYYMPYSVFMSTKIVPAGGVYYATL